MTMDVDRPPSCAGTGQRRVPTVAPARDEFGHSLRHGIRQVPGGSAQLIRIRHGHSWMELGS